MDFPSKADMDFTTLKLLFGPSIHLFQESITVISEWNPLAGEIGTRIGVMNRVTSFSITQLLYSCILTSNTLQSRIVYYLESEIWSFVVKTMCWSNLKSRAM